MKKVKYYTLLCINLLITGISCAQSPLAFNYQGVARDANGELLISRNISLEISLHRDFEDGSIDYQEEHFVTTNERGLFSLQIGMGHPILGNLANLNWGEHQYYLNTKLDINGMRDFINLGSSKLMSVPYALHAMTASQAGMDDQSLALEGNILHIENGNSVDLSGLTGSGNTDNQNLALEGNLLSIERGNEVDLSHLLEGGGSAFWQGNQLGIHYTGQIAGLGPDPGSPLLSLNVSSQNTTGYIYVQDKPGNSYVIMEGDAGMYSYQNDEIRYWLGNNNDGGILNLYGTTGQQKILLSSSAGNPNAGWLGIFGSNGNANTRITHLSGNPNHGYISVHGEENDAKAGIYVDADGNGRIFADMKNFRMKHPDDADREIVYASLEGPEAAAYIRGSSNLKNGTATIDFPDHFKHVISDRHGMTVLVTPLSAGSKGLAVVRKSKEGFSVRELLNGTGNYRFDWEVKGIRNGFESYEVVQQKATLKPAEISSRELSKELRSY